MPRSSIKPDRLASNAWFHLRSRSESLQKKVGRIPIAECAQPAQKKVYGFRDLLRSFSCSLAGDSAEHNDIRVGIAAQTVCAVRDARHFTGSPKARDHLAVSRQCLRLFMMRTPPIVWCTLGTALMT